MIKIYNEIQNAEDFERWVREEGWGLEYLIELIDGNDLWEEAFAYYYDYFNEEQFVSACRFNDLLRFNDSFESYLEELARARKED